MTKICNVCKESKTLDQFHRNKKVRDGHQGRCKICQKAKGAAYDSLHRSQRIAYKQTQRGRYATYKDSAKTRAVLFDLTFDEFLVYWQADCSYCGKAIATIGIDRIDSSVGYTLANCIPCCTVCNMMKKDHGTDFWLDHMLQVLRTQEVI